MDEAAQTLTNLFIKHGAADSRSQFTGCPESQIVELETAVGVRIPQTFRTFLSIMGRGAGQYANGDPDALYDSIRREQNPSKRIPFDLFAESDNGNLVSLGKIAAIPNNALITFPVTGLPYYFCIICNNEFDSPVYYFDFERDWIELERRYETVFDYFDDESFYPDLGG